MILYKELIPNMLKNILIKGNLLLFLGINSKGKLLFLTKYKMANYEVCFTNNSII